MSFACQHKASFGITAIEFQARQAREIVASDVVPEIFPLEEQWPVSRCGFGAIDLRPRYTRDRAGVDDLRRIDPQFRSLAQFQSKRVVDQIVRRPDQKLGISSEMQRVVISADNLTSNTGSRA